MDYKVADLNLADYGRMEINLAEHEMPGLMAMRARYGDSKPLAGARIAGSLHMTIQTAVLIETLVALGAEVRWASLQHLLHPGPRGRRRVVGPNGTPEDPRGYPSSPGRARRWRSTGGAPSRSCSGPRTRSRTWSSTTVVTPPCSSTSVPRPRRPASPPTPADASHGQKIIFGRPQRLARRGDALDTDRRRHQGRHRGDHHRRAAPVRHDARRHAALPAINVNDSVTKSKFDNRYGYRHSLIDGINRATDVLIGGKVAMVCGYGDVGKGCAESLRGQGARVIVTEIDPICALQAAMDGYQVAQAGEVLDTADIIVTATGSRDVITVDQMARMKHQAIVSNIGHFDNEIDMAGLDVRPTQPKINIKPQVRVEVH